LAPIIFIPGKRANPTSAGIALTLRESWYDMACPENQSWVHESECIRILQRHESNASQGMCLPCMTFYGLIPSNIQKFESAGFKHVSYANNINVVNAKNFGITIVAVINIIAMLE
jgi:hypothetical protein